MKAIYTAQCTSTGGRDGHSQSSDGRLKVSLSVPKEMGGDSGSGTNPEQLFAAGYSACFIGAIKFAADQDKLALPDDIKIEARVGLGQNSNGAGFAISAALTVYLSGMERSAAEALVAKAHEICPYSNATRGNVDVQLTTVV